MQKMFCFVLLIGLLVIGLTGCGWFKGSPEMSRITPTPLPPVSRLVSVPSPIGSVFFPSGQSTLMSQQTQALAREARWLRDNPGVNVLISGNADQRAGEGYNIELGRQRADAVKKTLVEFGVSPDRLQTASYGKSRPVCTATTQDCYAANRRVDLTMVG